MVWKSRTSFSISFLVQCKCAYCLLILWRCHCLCIFCYSHCVGILFGYLWHELKKIFLCATCMHSCFVCRYFVTTQSFNHKSCRALKSVGMLTRRQILVKWFSPFALFFLLLIGRNTDGLCVLQGFLWLFAPLQSFSR